MFSANTVRCIVGMSFMTAVVANAQNADFDWLARAGISYSDNVTRSAANEVDSASAVAGLQFNGRRPSGRMRYDAVGDVGYYSYFDNDVDAELVGGARGTLSYDFVPERFVWDIRGSFDQQRADLLRPASPDNREDILALSTGPTLRVRLGGNLEASIESRYSRVDYSERGLDNDTIGGRLELLRELSQGTTIGAGMSYSDVTYEAPPPVVVTDFKRTEYFLTGRLRGARTSIEADLGYAEIKGGSLDEKDPVVRFRLTRQLTPALAAYVGATQEYATSEAVLDSFAPIGEDGGRAVLSAAPRLQRSGTLGLTYLRARTSANIGLTTSREKGVLTTVGDRDTTELRAQISRSLTPRSSAGLYASYLRDEFSQALADAEETSVGATYSTAIGARLGLDAQLGWRKRDANFALGGYDELTAGVFLRYGRVRQRNLVELAPSRSNVQ